MPAGGGIVEGGDIPYTPEAAAKAKENLPEPHEAGSRNQMLHARNPARELPAFPVPDREGQRDIAFAYEYATSNRVVNMGKFSEGAVDTWMGTSNGHWEGDTLVVDVSGLTAIAGSTASGDFQTENTHVVERFTLADADHINYEATIEDKTIYTRPWKISTVFYRRKEKDAQLNEFKCVEFVGRTDLRRPEEEVDFE